MFLIGFYAGVKKPVCSNHFLERFVNEVCHLCKNGIILKGQTYPFFIKNLIMDAPAKAYILGVVSHNAKVACTKCHCVGVRKPRKGFASTAKQKKIARQALCFLNMDAVPREHEDFFDDSVPRCDPKGGCDLHHLNEEEIIDRGAYDDEASIFFDESDDEGFIEEDIVHPEKRNRQTPKHHKHWTILSKITRLHLIKGIPLDPMHLLYIGCCPKWVKIFCDNSSLLSALNKLQVSQRLLQARQYQPCEFQRFPDTLAKVKLWKATQFRVFLIYIGLFALYGLIDEKYFRHFSYLVCCARYMSKKLPSDEAKSSEVRKKIAQIVRPLLRKFVEDAVSLFGPEFVTYNVHNLIHIVDDYLEFGSLENFSAFIFESFLKNLKKYVHSGYKPRQQNVNRYSADIRIGTYSGIMECDSDNRAPLDDVALYYEEPQLFVKGKEYTVQEGENEEALYESFSELHFRDFKLKVGLDGDCFCLIESRHYVRISTILRKVASKEIFIIGKYFMNVENLFTVPMNSENIGMVSCHNLSEERWFSVTELETKCYAFRIQPTGGRLHSICICD